MELRDRNDQRVDGVGDARDDRLECCGHVAADEQRVDAQVRHGAVAALALNGDDEVVFRAHCEQHAQRSHAQRSMRVG